MTKLIKHELFLLSRRWWAILLILGALLGSYLLDGASLPAGVQASPYSRDGAPERRIDAKYYILRSKWDYQMSADHFRTHRDDHMTEEKLAGQFGLEYTEGMSYEDLYPLTAKPSYVRILWFAGGLLALCAVLPAVLIRYPLDTGVPAQTARFCGAPGKTALAKIIVLDCLVVIGSLLNTLIRIWAYAGSIVSQTDFSYVLYTLLLRLLMDVSVLSVPVYLAFAIRNLKLLVTVNVLYGMICYRLNVAACGSDRLLPIPIPAYLHGLRPIWQAGGPGGWILFAALVSLGWIVLFAVLSVRSFARSLDK